MISLIAFFCLLIASLAICGVSAFKVQRDKLLLFVTLKGFSLLSLLIFSITCANLVSDMSGTTIFIISALAIQMFSGIISILPTKNDLFAPLYNCLDMLSALCLALAGLLIVPLSPFGLPIGLGVGIIAAIIIGLIKRDFVFKTDFTQYAIFVFATALLGQIIVILLQSISLQTIFFCIGALIFFAYSIFRTFISSDNKKVLIAQNILYYLSYISIITSIFLILF